MKIKSFCLVLVFSLSCGIVHSADLKDGFMETPWGSEVKNLVNFSKVKANGNVSYYVNPSRVFEFKENKIQNVIYGFYNEQFFAVYIKIDKIELFGEVKNYMTTKYGEPAQKMSMKSGLKTYRWKYKNVKMKLKENQKDGNVKLAFYYTPLSSKINEDRQEIFVEKSVKWFPIDKERPPETLPSIPLLRF